METHTVTTIEELEALYKKPMEMTLRKETPVINAEYRRLIEAAPFLAIASVGPEGMDCSPRGDAEQVAFVRDEKTVAIPDRRGNNRLDTLRNIVQDPRVALLFLIPGLNETLRINGTARLSTDPGLLADYIVGDKKPATVILIRVETMYFQCARALQRSKLWDPASQVDSKTLPTAGELVKSVLTTFDAHAYDGALRGRQEKTLY